MILWFDEVKRGDIARVGGKGANLGEMSAAGLPVPEGFCIDVEAYKTHLRSGSLWPKIEAMLQEITTEDVVSLDSTAVQIRQIIETAPMPSDLQHKIKEAYMRLLRLGYERVAVRSSATAEDLPEASFAGQQETFLSIIGEEDVLQHVKKCWSSLWTARSISYRTHNQFNHEEVYLSVVVQGQIESRKSGVLFTMNPLNGSKDQMLINASYGLGEMVVSGKVTPDTYIVSKRKRYNIAVHRKLGTKEMCLESHPIHGTITKEVPEPDRDKYCLSYGELRQLQRLGRELEQYYGAPQDIEWAFSGGKLYALQTRPITSLYLPEYPQTKLGKIEKKELDNFKEHLPTPPYPLEYETMMALLEEKHHAYRSLGLSIPAAEQVIRIDRNGVLSIHPVSPRPTLSFLKLPSHVRRMLRDSSARISVEEEQSNAKRLQQLMNVQISGLNDRELVQQIESIVKISKNYGQIRFHIYVFPMVLLGFKLKLLIRMSRLKRPVSEYELLSNLDYKTAVIEKALNALAVSADLNPVLRAVFLECPAGEVQHRLKLESGGQAFLKEVETFLQEHGARTMKAYMPFSNEASWSENVSSLYGTIAAMLRSGSIHNFDKRQEDINLQFYKLTEEIRKGLPRFLADSFSRTLEQFRAAFKGREWTLYAIEECYVALRKAMQEAADRLKHRGFLTAPEDILYLKLSEVYRLLDRSSGEVGMEDAAGKIRERRINREFSLAVWNVNEHELDQQNQDHIKGLPGSGGLAEGNVKVISGAAEFGKLEKGDVLVCSFTDPAWTPLFLLASAVVSDTGGPLSHAAIVAREYRIPAVLGTKVATSCLQDGDRVMVDGFKGTVTVLKDQLAASAT